MITYYNYHPVTGEYISQGTAMESPLEPGYFLIPDYSVTIAPPQPEAGKVCCWNGANWFQTADYRGKRFWNTETKEEYLISEPGVSPAPDWTDLEPSDIESVWTGNSWEIPLFILKKRKIAAIRHDVDKTLSSIQENFSATEFQSWSKQEAGARALIQNPEASDADAEFVRAMARARGIPVTELIEKINACIIPAMEAMAHLLGEQQRREDLVNAATAPEELEHV